MNFTRLPFELKEEEEIKKNTQGPDLTRGYFFACRPVQGSSRPHQEA